MSELSRTHAFFGLVLPYMQTVLTPLSKMTASLTTNSLPEDIRFDFPCTLKRNKSPKMSSTRQIHNEVKLRTNYDEMFIKNKADGFFLPCIIECH